MIAALVMAVGLVGCTGPVTGLEYKADVVYKVVRNGVTTFMTAEQIKAAKLDKVDTVIVETYEAVKGKN